MPEDPEQYKRLVNLETRLNTKYRDKGYPRNEVYIQYVDNAGWEIWRRRLYELMEKGYPYEAAMRTVENEISAIWNETLPWTPDEIGWPPAPPTPPVPPDDPPLARLYSSLDGAFRVEGTNQVHKWQSLTSFRLYEWWRKERARARRWAEFAADLGANTLRVLDGATWMAHTYDEAYYSDFPAFVAWVTGEGFRLDWVVCCDGQVLLPTQAQQEAHVEKFKPALRSSPGCFLSFNEPWKNGVNPQLWTAPAGVLACKGAPNLDAVTAGMSDAEAAEILYAPRWGYAEVHSPRDDEWPRKVGKTAWELQHGNPRDPVTNWPGFLGYRGPVVENEPKGIGSAPGRTQSASDCFDAAACGHLLCAGSTIHGDFGINCEVPTGKDLQCAEAWAAGWDAIPADAQLGAYTRGGLGDCPVDHDDSKALRTFAMIQGNRAVVVVVRKAYAGPPVGRQGWRVVETRGPNHQVALLQR